MSAEPANWDGLTLLAPFGYVQPHGIQGHPDTERGDVYAGPIGAPVQLPATAYYDAADSTRYQSVFRTPSGNGINVMHIDAIPFADGQQVNAGTVIGQITARTGTYTDKGHVYFSQFPDATHGVVEVGLYDNPADASNRNVGYLDPAAMLAGGPTSSGDTATADALPAGGWSGGGPAITGAPASTVSAPPSNFWDAGGWARFLGPVIRRYALVAMLALAAILVAVMMLKPMIMPKGLPA